MKCFQGSGSAAADRDAPPGHDRPGGADFWEIALPPRVKSGQIIFAYRATGRGRAPRQKRAPCGALHASGLLQFRIVPHLFEDLGAQFIENAAHGLAVRVGMRAVANCFQHFRLEELILSSALIFLRVRRLMSLRYSSKPRCSDMRTSGFLGGWCSNRHHGSTPRLSHTC